MSLVITFFMTLFTVLCCQAQDQVHLLTGEVYEGKIEEVGIDSIRLTQTLNQKKTKEIIIPNFRVSYFQHQNGEQEFIAHDVITLKNKVILAKIVEVTEDDVKYLDAQDNSSEIKSISQNKILSVQFGEGEQKTLYDTIFLIDGETIKGVVVELGIDSVSFKNIKNDNTLDYIANNQVEKIIYKSGYEEVFSFDKIDKGKENKKWWKFW